MIIYLITCIDIVLRKNPEFSVIVTIDFNQSHDNTLYICSSSECSNSRTGDIKPNIDIDLLLLHATISEIGS